MPRYISGGGGIFAAAPVPSTNDGAALGAAATGEWSDLFLASGGVINWANGNVTLTHASGLLTLAGSLNPGTNSSFDFGSSASSLRWRNVHMTGDIVNDGGDLGISDNAVGKSMNIKRITELHTLAAAATSDTTMTFPAGALVLGVSMRVTTTITASAGTSMTVGDSTTAGRYSTAAPSAVVVYTLGTTHQQGPSTYAIYTAATAVRFTAGGGGSFTAGVVRVTGYYIDMTAPTS